MQTRDPICQTAEMSLVLTEINDGVARLTLNNPDERNTMTAPMVEAIVAFLDADGLVVRTVQMPRQRIGLPVPRAQMVIEAEAGAFARWGVHVGDVIELRDDDQ